MLTKPQLRELYGTPSERSLRKSIGELEAQSKFFISRSPLLFIASYSETGDCDCSPRGGPPGFVQVLSNSQIAIPDFRGNNRLDSLENIIDTGRIGCVFLVPGISETLRINGSAAVCSSADVIEQFDCADLVKAYILVDIAQVYIHCGKSLIRSAVWEASSHVPTTEFPSLGTILNAHVGEYVMSEDHFEIAKIYSQTMTEQGAP